MKKVKMYESLTKFIPDLEKGDFGGWTEQTGDGTPEKPLEFCHIEYSEPVHKLLDTLFEFRKVHGRELKLDFYPAIMDEIGTRWQGKDPSDIDVSVLDGRLIVGFLLVEISMCRFSDSVFLDLCKAGTVLRCLKRLKEIDETEEDAVSIQGVDFVAGKSPEGIYAILPQAKQPLRVTPAHKRKLKEYKYIFEFQEDYPTREKKEKFVRNLQNYEIDELIELCDNIQGKIYYENQKKKEKVFEYRKRFALKPFDECKLTIYDGPGTEKYVEYGEGLLETNGMTKVRIGRKEIRAVQAAIEDNVLFETENMEDPYQVCILDGTEYQFFFAVKGCENEMFGDNIEECREDYDHCMHSAHAIQVLEEIRDILVPVGVPEKYFDL